MDYKQTALDILKAVGGRENLASAAHCATRLRLVIADNAKCDKKAVENVDGVKGVFEASGQLQIIIGTGTVNKVYDEFVAAAGIEADQLDVALGTGMQANLQGLNLDVETSDVRDTTRIPAVNLRLGLGFAQAGMDSMSVQIEQPEVAVSVAPQRRNAGQPRFSVKVGSGKLNADLGTDRVQADLLDVAATVFYNKNQEDIFLRWMPRGAFHLQQGVAHLERAAHGAHIVRADGQAVFERHGVAEVHDGADLREALALGDAGQQGFDGAHILVRIYAECAEGLSVRDYLRRLLDLSTCKSGLALRNGAVQQLADLRVCPGVVHAAHGDDAEAGVGQKLKHCGGNFESHN